MPRHAGPEYIGAAIVDRVADAAEVDAEETRREHDHRRLRGVCGVMLDTVVLYEPPDPARRAVQQDAVT